MPFFTSHMIDTGIPDSGEKEGPDSLRRSEIIAVPEKFHEGFQCVQLALEIGAQFARLSRQALFEFLEAAIVIAHLRSEKDVADAVHVAALIDRAIILTLGRLVLLCFHGITPSRFGASSQENACQPHPTQVCRRDAIILPRPKERSFKF